MEKKQQKLYIFQHCLIIMETVQAYFYFKRVSNKYLIVLITREKAQSPVKFRLFRRIEPLAIRKSALCSRICVTLHRYNHTHREKSL